MDPNSKDCLTILCLYWFVVSKREAIKVSLLSGRDTSLRGTEDTEFCPPLTQQGKLSERAVASWPIARTTARLHLSFLENLCKNSRRLKYDSLVVFRSFTREEQLSMLAFLSKQYLDQLGLLSKRCINNLLKDEYLLEHLSVRIIVE